MGLFAEELGYLEQDIDQLYDNWFVETCEPWVLPYIAALVGASPMREIGTDQAGLLRAYIANLLQYRQAKGTAAVIEQVARDVSGWSVVAVEFFQRLATAQHVNQIRRHVPVFADLRNAAARSSRSPFSSMAHAAAAGPPAGWSGRFNIPHLGLFIWRHAAAPIWPVEDGKPGYLGGAQPRLDVPDPGQLRFDPLGRDLPLVNRPAPDLSVAARMTARTVPAPLSRDAVHAALNAARSTGTSPDHWFEQAPPFRVRLEGIELGPDKLYCCNLEADETGAWRRPANSGEVMVDPVLGRLSLHAADEGKAVETGYALAQAFDIGGGAYDRRASLEQWLADFVIAGEPPPWQIGVSRIDGAESDDPDQAGPVVASMREAVNRWNAFATDGARGIIAVLDNATYSEALDNTSRILLPRGSQLAIVAAAWADRGTRRRCQTPHAGRAVADAPPPGPARIGCNRRRRCRHGTCRQPGARRFADRRRPGRKRWRRPGRAAALQLHHRRHRFGTARRVARRRRQCSDVSSHQPLHRLADRTAFGHRQDRHHPFHDW
jgi:hypothetical protein